MKYNIGDKVRIRNLEVNDVYGEVYVIDGMLEYCGKIVEIEKINNTFNDRYYILKDCKLLWHGDMLEPIKVETKKTKEKTSLEKALELLNMTEEEMNREYYKREYTALAEEIARKFVDKCSNCIKCDDSCNICEALFTIEYLREKGLLKDEF